MIDFNGKLSRLKLLKDEFELNNWSIDGFEFDFNKTKCFIIAELLPIEERKKLKQLFKLTFIKENNLNDKFNCLANSNSLDVDVKQLKIFFNILDNIKDIRSFFDYFYQCFNSTIPFKINIHKPKILKNLIYNSLSKNIDDANKIYCFKLKRNPINCNRTAYNEDKAKLLCTDLYNKFKNDKTISFCFTDNKEEEKSETEIIRNFIS